MNCRRNGRDFSRKNRRQQKETTSHVGKGTLFNVIQPLILNRKKNILHLQLLFEHTFVTTVDGTLRRHLTKKWNLANRAIMC